MLPTWRGPKAPPKVFVGSIARKSSESRSGSENETVSFLVKCSLTRKAYYQSLSVAFYTPPSLSCYFYISLWQQVQGVQAPVQVKKNKKKPKSDVKPVQIVTTIEAKEPDDGETIEGNFTTSHFQTVKFIFYPLDVTFSVNATCWCCQLCCAWPSRKISSFAVMPPSSQLIVVCLVCFHQVRGRPKSVIERRGSSAGRTRAPRTLVAQEVWRPPKPMW